MSGELSRDEKIELMNALGSLWSRVENPDVCVTIYRTHLEDPVVPGVTVRYVDESKRGSLSRIFYTSDFLDEFQFLSKGEDV